MLKSRIKHFSQNLKGRSYKCRYGSPAIFVFLKAAAVELCYYFLFTLLGFVLFSFDFAFFILGFAFALLDIVRRSLDFAFALLNFVRRSLDFAFTLLDFVLRSLDFAYALLDFARSYQESALLFVNSILSSVCICRLCKAFVDVKGFL